MKTKLLLLLMVLASLPLLAGNSVFAFDGNPIRYYGNDIYSLGMGDTGASDVFRINSGYGNPALNNLGNRSLFSTGLMPGYNYYSSRDFLRHKLQSYRQLAGFPIFQPEHSDQTTPPGIPVQLPLFRGGGQSARNGNHRTA